MNQTSLFTAALGLQQPWEVVDVRFSEQERRIDFDVAFEAGTRFACPKCCAQAQSVHDTRSREWRHLNFFQFDAYIHAKIPVSPVLSAARPHRSKCHGHAHRAALPS